MAQLIDKDALVAEIEKRIKEHHSGYQVCLKDMLSFIDTLEVKEVDLEKEFYDFLDTLIGKDNGHLSEDELFCIAKHFFELGINAKGE